MISLRLPWRIAHQGRKPAPLRVVQKVSKSSNKRADIDCGCLAFVAGILIWSTRKNRQE